MLRDKLRLHTRVHHERIERVLDLPHSVRDPADYARLLSGYYGFYVPHEAGLRIHASRLSAFHVDLDARLKADKLSKDLHACGITALEIAALPLCRSVPELPSWRHALGSLYVLEGATLGGQILSRALQKERSIIDPATQMNFFLSYGARTGAMWRSFVETLNAIELTEQDESDVLTGAAKTFKAMENWMSDVYAVKSTEHMLEHV